MPSYDDTSPDDPSPDELDDELRRVSLPEGLLSRLQQLAVSSDEQLGAALRHVPLPKGLLLRLRRIPSYDDATLDAELGDVPLPPGMLSRLEQSALWAAVTEPESLELESIEAGSAEADRALMVEPAGERRGGGRWEGRRRLLGQVGLAASLLLLLGGSFAAGLPGLLRWATPRVDPPSDVVVDPPDAVVRPLPAAIGPRNDGRQPQIVSTLPHSSPNAPGPIESRPPSPGTSDLTEPGVDGPDVIGSASSDDVLADDSRGPGRRPRVVNRIKPRGVVPEWRDADLLLAQLRTQVNPFVKLSPAMQLDKDRRLLVCRVPLATGTESYDLAWDLLGGAKRSAVLRSRAQRRLAAEVRPEDFLAAMEYDFPRPNGPGPALRTAGGVSPFGGPGLRLLQVAVQTGDLPSQPRAGVHLVLVVDTSIGSGDGQMLGACRRAVDGLIGRLRADDRVSILTLGDSARLVVEEAGPTDAAALRAGIKTLAAGGATAANLADGLRRAYAMLGKSPQGAARTRRLVLLTDGGWEIGDVARKQIDALSRSGVAENISLSVVDLGSRPSDRPMLERLAAAGAGACRRAESVQEIGWCFDEIVSGRSPVVADGARLTVAFNPRSVASYRLIGHEPTSILGVVAAPVEVPLRADDVSTALFEVELRSDGGDELVATAELNWNVPGQSQVQRLSQRITRWQLANSLLETPASVQTAAIAAETAELLRHSPLTPPSTHSWSRVRQVAAEIDPAAAAKPSLRQLMLLVEEAERLGSP